MINFARKRGLRLIQQNSLLTPPKNIDPVWYLTVSPTTPEGKQIKWYSVHWVQKGEAVPLATGAKLLATAYQGKITRATAARPTPGAYKSVFCIECQMLKALQAGSYCWLCLHGI